MKTNGLLQCRHCPYQTSLIAGTVFAYSKLPLTIWLLAMYLLTQQKNALSALEPTRHLGVSYPTAWSLKHKLPQVMLERNAERRLTSLIEIDDVYWSGDCHGQTPGRSSPNNKPFVALSRADGRPPALRGNVVARFRKRELAAWTEKCADSDSIVVGEGMGRFRAAADANMKPHPVVTGGGPASVKLEELRWLHTIVDPV